MLFKRYVYFFKIAFKYLIVLAVGLVIANGTFFFQGLLALEGELTPILVQMVKSANTNGLLDNDCDSSNYQNM